MDPVTEDEARAMRSILREFYGPLVDYWTINREVFEVMGQMIVGSEQCSRAMHLVPRPWNLANPLKWARRELRQALLRYLKTPEGRHYVICMKAAARSFRTDFELAQLGV